MADHDRSPKLQIAIDCLRKLILMFDEAMKKGYRCDTFYLTVLYDAVRREGGTPLALSPEESYQMGTAALLLERLSESEEYLLAMKDSSAARTHDKAFACFGLFRLTLARMRFGNMSEEDGWKEIFSIDERLRSFLKHGEQNDPSVQYAAACYELYMLPLTHPEGAVRIQ